MPAENRAESEMPRRLAAAMIEVVAEKGYAATTVAQVIDRAGTGRATFYAHFDDKEACFLVAYENLTSDLLVYIRAVFDAFDRWPDQVRVALDGCLRWASAGPGPLMVAMLGVLEAGPVARQRFATAAEPFIPLIDLGREYSPRGDELPEGTARAIIGGIGSVIFNEVASGRAHSLSEMQSALAYIALAPMLGHDAALEELRSPLPHHTFGPSIGKDA